MKVRPTGLILEDGDTESSSEATRVKIKKRKEIPITHNYSLNTVGEGALYLPVLAQHSTVPLIATLLLMHSTFCYIFLRHPKAHPYVAGLKTEWI